jgi:hypothetical protein
MGDADGIKTLAVPGHPPHPHRGNRRQSCRTVLAAAGDPMADPGALHRIRAVYAGGTAVPGAGT